MPVSRGNPQKTSVSSASSAFSGFGFDPGKCPYSPLISFATLALCFSFFARFLLSSRFTTGGGPRTERDNDFTAFVALNLPGFFFLGTSQFNQNPFHRKGREGRKGRKQEQNLKTQRKRRKQRDLGVVTLAKPFSCALEIAAEFAVIPPKNLRSLCFLCSAN